MGPLQREAQVSEWKRLAIALGIWTASGVAAIVLAVFVTPFAIVPMVGAWTIGSFGIVLAIIAAGKVA